MPLPLIVPVIIGAGGALGLGKATKAGFDNFDANNQSKIARLTVEKWQKKIEKVRTSCEEALQQVGQTKYDALTIEINDFLHVFGQLKNYDYQAQTLSDIQLAEFSYEALKSLKQEISFLKHSSLGVVGGSTAGALTALGAYNGTMALAAASTGTAINTLNGVAATNATLAWLGGGTLTSGGLGMAGGTMVLGTMAAGPALLIAGWYMGAKATENLNNAMSNQLLANKFGNDASTAIKLTKSIQQLAQLLNEILGKLRLQSKKDKADLDLLIQKDGVDYSQYSTEGKEVVAKGVKTIQLLKALIDVSILDAEGNILGDAESNISSLVTDIKSQF